MDSDILVSDQALQQIVSTLENEALGIQGAYLIKMTSDEGFEHRSFRVVSRAEPREIIFKYIRLRREGQIPGLPEDVAFTPVHPNDREASRVLDYAAQMGTPLVEHAVA